MPTEHTKLKSAEEYAKEFQINLILSGNWTDFFRAIQHNALLFAVEVAADYATALKSSDHTTVQISGIVSERIKQAILTEANKLLPQQTEKGE